MNEYVMSPLRRAFYEMIRAAPGPDAARYASWACSGDPDDAERLSGYVRAAIPAIERFGEAYDETRRLPMLRALLKELEAAG